VAWEIQQKGAPNPHVEMGTKKNLGTKMKDRGFGIGHLPWMENAKQANGPE